MGGKTTSASSATSIPPQVLAQYTAVNAKADATANTPFQQYGGQFVAPVNAQQTAGINSTNAAAGEAQPYYGAATNAINGAQSGTGGVNNAALGLTAASAGPVNAQQIGGQQISQFMSPYVQDVAQSEANLLGQNNAQAQSGALGTAISSGAFGGDRTGIAAANLQQQQNLSNANIYSGILNQGFNTALGAAQQQQGVNLAAGQANRAALGSAGQQLAGIGQTQYGEGANTANTLAALGSGAQTAGLQGGAAQLQAGTVQQQTQQAQDTAQYNQFLQQQSYPFQTDQFLANIAEGTGALSGSTGTTSQPGGFFSDERLKEDKKPIGKTYDGQTIYSYKMKGDPRTRIGLMAQEVEGKHPDAVGVAGGYRTVDYGKATEKAANKSHFYAGGVVPIRKAAGGELSAGDLSSILAAQQAMYGGLGGGAGMGHVPTVSGGSHGSLQSSAPQIHQSSPIENANALAQLSKTGMGIYSDISRMSKQPKSAPKTAPQATQALGVSPEATQAADGSAGLAAAQDAAPAATEMASDLAPGLARGGMALASGGPAGVYMAQDPESTEAGSNIATADKPASSTANSALQGQGVMSVPNHPPPAGGQFSPTTTLHSKPTPATETSEGLGLAAIAGYIAEAALANRGGRMERKHYDSGGSPYSNDYQNQTSGLMIPNDPSPAAAQAIGAKAPTINKASDAQDLASLATSGASIASIIGDIAAVAAKRGGRIHKDGGGGLDPGDPLPDLLPDGTPNVLPEQKVETSRSARGVAPEDLKYTGDRPGLSLPAADEGAAPKMPAVEPDPTPAPKGVAPKYDAYQAEAPQQNNDEGWFHQHAGSILPILQGIAAMGTAPTRSLGVALASGLGAGAGAYVPTQEGLANASLTQQRAREQGYQADLQSATNNMAIPIINRAGTATPGSSGTSGPAGVPGPSPITFPTVDPTAPLQDQLRQKYRNVPTTADEGAQQQAFGYQAAATKNPGWKDPTDALIEQRRQSTDYAVKQDAQQNYDAAIRTWKTAKDPAIRDSAAAAAYAYSPWTGDKPDTSTGVQLNDRTHEPFIGDQAQRLSPERYTEMKRQATTPVEYPDGKGGMIMRAPFRNAGFSNPDDYIASLPPQGMPDVPGRAPATASGPAGLAAPSASTEAPASSPLSERRGAPTPSTAVTGATPPRAGRTTPTAADPVLSKFLSDPQFKSSKVGGGLGSSPGIEDRATMENRGKLSSDLRTDASAINRSAPAAIQYAEAAKAILESKGRPIVGPLGGLVAKLTAPFGSVDASNYEILAKQLGNLAAQSNPFPHATDKEVQLQFGMLSPDTAKTPAALASLLDENTKIQKYALETASKLKPFLDKGGDPSEFFNAINKYYPRADAVNPPATAVRATGAAPAVGAVRGQWKFNGGDPADRSNWTKQ